MKCNKRTIVVDIDNTICTQTDGQYLIAKPFLDRIDKINKLYDEGHCIIYMTARGMNMFKGDIDKCYETYYDLTQKQLKDWGCKYHNLILGKIMYDEWIDDKAINASDYFSK